MTRVAVIIAATVVTAMATVFLFIGLFDRVTLSHESKGPYQLIFREYRGPYRAVPFIVNNVYTYARDTLRLPSAIPFALYYDPPRMPENDSLRSIGGAIVDSIPSLKHGLHKGSFYKTDAVVGSFRLRGFFSPAIGGYKFYSALPRFLQKTGLRQSGPVMEIYEAKHRRILFIAPVAAPGARLPQFPDNS